MPTLIDRPTFFSFQLTRAQKLRTKNITRNILNTNAPKDSYVNKLADKTQEVEELQKRVQELQAQLVNARATSVYKDDSIAQAEEVHFIEEKVMTQDAEIVENTVIKSDQVDPLVNVKTTNTYNNVNNDDLFAQAEVWKYKIDRIYNEIQTALENYYLMSSKERLLKLRTKFKESTEQNHQTINIDDEFVHRVRAFKK